MNEYCCTCKYWRRSPTDGGFICCNPDADSVHYNTRPDYGCYHYEEAKDENRTN